MKKILIFLICALTLAGCSDNIVPITQKNDPEDPYEAFISEMTLEEKVSQMFISRCPEKNAVSLAEEFQPGGYILFAADFKNSDPETFRKTAESYQDAVKIPMFIAVDEEGGTVNRVSRYTAFRDEPFKSPQNVYKNGGMDAIATDAKEKSEFLLDLGINLNFAPVCDISTNPDDFIYDRSFGKDAIKTGEYVSTVVDEMNSAGIGSVLKHFPGYGNNVDTHTGIAIDKRPYEEFKKNDFIPFISGANSGAGMVLVSHNIVECMDEDLPASLSPQVHEILRDELGFDGIIITDDLAMDGITEYTDDSNAAVLAVKAGNDMLCCSNFTEQIPAVIDAVRNGEIDENQINESVIRILKYKEMLGLITIV